VLYFSYIPRRVGYYDLVFDSFRQYDGVVTMTGAIISRWERAGVREVESLNPL
jgi:hypothetical protein